MASDQLPFAAKVERKEKGSLDPQCEDYCEKGRDVAQYLAAGEKKKTRSAGAVLLIAASS